MHVSVICPVHDVPPDLLRAAVRSALRSGGDAVAEVILVDDASGDAESMQAMRSLERAESRVRLIQIERNVGPASARNHGLARAEGDWIGFLDADDLWLPGRLNAAAALLEREDATWIGARHVLLHSDGTMQAAPSIADVVSPHCGAALAGPDLTRRFIANFWMHLGAMLVRADLLRRIGGFADGLRYYEDFLLLARLSVVAPLHLLDLDAYAWRRTGGGLTGSPERLASSSMRMHGIAGADPLLRPFRREVRWARYSARKGLALNNLLSGHRTRALALALDAWRLDPREVSDLLRFLRLWSGQARNAAERQRYSGAEVFEVGDRV